LLAAGERHGIDFSLPWNSLPESARQLALNGSGGEEYEIIWHFRRKDRTGSHTFKGRWIGLSELVNQEYRRKHADHRGTAMMDVMNKIICQECNGTRLKPDVLRFRIAETHIGTITELPIRDVSGYLEKMEANLSDIELPAARLLTNFIHERLKTISELGLGYLTLNRTVESLSGGEYQRIRLAGQIASGLEGITYVLDEPTAGLHPADTERLLERIRELSESGNTIVMVEHDPEVIRLAHHIIDLGPGAGTEGGKVMAEGTPTEIMNQTASLTGKYLKQNRLQITSGNRKWTDGITISGAFARNLRDLSVTFPSGVITVVTGVSGSGKSTLVHEVLEASFIAGQPVGCSKISGLEKFSGVINASEKRGFTDGRGTAGTYLGIFDPIRELFASTEDALANGLTKGHFSFLNAEGRCPECNGLGETRISMDFMADVVRRCESCNGSRYQSHILRATIRGKAISDVLQMTFRDAGTFFTDTPGIAKKCLDANRVGLGYLHLGQPLESLSGGESQRLALLHELLTVKGGRRLFLFDEPTGGLHPADLAPLIRLFDNLADAGHVVVIIEHNPTVILHADHITDLGPEGGDRGGFLVYQGDVAGLLNHSLSMTGLWMKKMCF